MTREESTILDMFSRGTRRTGAAQATAETAAASQGAGTSPIGGDTATDELAAGAGGTADQLGQNWPTDEKKKAEYKATLPAKSKREIRLRIIYPQGQEMVNRLFAYSHLNEIVLTSHQWLALVFSHVVIVMEGRHLDQLLDDLQDERIRALLCYQPHRHLPPTEGEPCITKFITKGVVQFAQEDSASIDA